ncbi:MAG: DedA family protein [Veillonella sp.]|nr:DedA family protein [Veillonella sp.]MBE6079598.1 DedA family protein [Veillonella sp.]
MDYLISFLETYGYAAMFITMVLENANVPIPSEIVLGFSGYLIAQGVFEMNMTMIVATAAGVVGSILSYWMGEHGGRPLLRKYGRYIFFNEHKFEMAEKMFNKYGGAAVFFGRLLPGIRTFISFPAGIARYPMGRFIIWTLLGTIPWTILLVWLGVKLGEHWQDLIEYNHEFLVIMIVVFAIIAVFFGIRYYRNKKRNQDIAGVNSVDDDLKIETKVAADLTDEATTEMKNNAVQDNTTQR